MITVTLLSKLTDLKLRGFHAALIDGAEGAHPLSVITPDGVDIGPELARIVIPNLAALPGQGIPEGLDAYYVLDGVSTASILARFSLLQKVLPDARALAYGVEALARRYEDEAIDKITLEPARRGYDAADKANADFAVKHYRAGDITLREAIHMAVTPVQVDTGTGPDCDTDAKLYSLRRLVQLGVIDQQRAIHDGAVILAQAAREEA